MSGLSRSNSKAGYHPSGNAAVQGTPGATSVWVGSSPPPNTGTHQFAAQTSSLRFSNDAEPRATGYKQHRNSSSSAASDNLTSPSESQYFVVSVRDSTSSAEGDSGYGGSANFSPTSPRSDYSGTGFLQNPVGSLPSLITSSGSGQYQPTYLQQSATGVGNMYSGFIPPASSLGALPQAVYDPLSLAAFQQPFTSSTSLSPELLIASLSQTNLRDSQPLFSPLPYLGQPVDITALTAAIAANQALLSPLQSPTSPVFMSPILNPTLPTLPLSPPAFPMATGVGGIPFSQSAFSISSAMPVLHGQASHASFVPYSTSSSSSNTTADVTAHKRINLSTAGSLEHADDQTTSGLGSSVPSTPSDSSPTSPQYEHDDHHPLDTHAHHIGVPPCYDRPADRDVCLRCGKKVYAMEKVGPVKDVLYHKTCFTCAMCRTTLTLNNFHHNDEDLADLHIYCHSHKPTARVNPVDASAVGIQRALSVPKLGRINDQIRGGPDARKHVHLDKNAVSIRSAMSVPAPSLQTSIKKREDAWFREQRKLEVMPPQGAVRHDGNQQRYEGSKSLYINT